MKINSELVVTALISIVISVIASVAIVNLQDKGTSSSADYSDAAGAIVNKNTSEYDALIARIKAMDPVVVKTKAGLAEIQDLAAKASALASRDYPNIVQPTFDINKDSSQTRPDVCSAWFALGDYYHNLYALTGWGKFNSMAQWAYNQGGECRRRLNG